MSVILIIEDDDSVRENLAELLEAEGYEVFSATNGRAGIEMAREKRPDLILCDIRMPEMDGYQVLETLRQDTITDLIPFLFLTARATPADLRRGMVLGADDYLTKPFRREELLKAINTRLQKRAQLVQQYESKTNELRRGMALMLPHELRTPLAIILGYASYLREAADTLSTGEVQEIADAIYDSSERLQRLIEKFLLYAELELMVTSPKQVEQLHRASMVAIAPLCEKLARQKAHAAERESDLVLALKDGVVQMEEQYLTFLLEELLDNALKFSSPGTEIRITNTFSGETMCLSISDQGIGMTPEQVTEMGAFLQFQRQRLEHPGQGLGLVISRRLVQLYGGELKIESASEQGTTVHVFLPLVQEEVEP